jgi:hypothetical protein
MIVSFTQIQSPLNFLIIQIFNCYCRSKIFELCHISEGPVSYVYIMSLLYILVVRQ